MIDPKSIRIGNYASMTESQKYEGSELEVISINKEFTECLRLIRESDEEWTYKNDIYPIPITEDWLIKFGLEKREVLTEIDPYKEYSIRNSFDIYCYMDKSDNCLIYGECIIGKDFFITKCDTIHDFQNIYKILAGKELKQI